jgi:hypothetical protein
LHREGGRRTDREREGKVKEMKEGRRKDGGRRYKWNQKRRQEEAK